jgi:hypothetical protein
VHYLGVAEPQTEGQTTSGVANGKNEEAWMELVRVNHGFVDRKTPALLLIDEVESGSVMPGESLKVPVTPGLHQVQVGTFDAWSNVLELVIEAGTVTGLKMTARPGAAWFSPLLLGRAVHYRLRLAGAT